jgi:competence protein ComEC
MVTVADCTLAIGSLIPEPQAGLVSGILFGTKTTLPTAILDELTATGTIHVVALSGTNITILMTIAAKLLDGHLPRRVVSAVTIAGIVAFVLWVGPSPSIVRAAIMGSLALLAVVFGRQAWGALCWVIACGVMILVQPAILTDVSFQLSALASLGLVVCDTRPKHNHSTRPADPPGEPQKTGTEFCQLPTVRGFLRSAVSTLRRDSLRAVEESLKTTLAAQAFTLPVILFTFGRLSLISPLVNLAIGWAIPPITTFGLLTVGIGAVVPEVAAPFAWITAVLVGYVLAAVHLFAILPGAAFGG